jgi:hypothetical protein
MIKVPVSVSLAMLEIVVIINVCKIYNCAQIIKYWMLPPIPVTV